MQHPRMQRHMPKRIFERLRVEHGYGYELTGLTQWKHAGISWPPRMPSASLLKLAWMCSP